MSTRDDVLHLGIAALQITDWSPGTAVTDARRSTAKAPLRWLTSDGRNLQMAQKRSSQSSRNTLASGVAESYNSAQFLGHLPGQRGARGPVAAGPGPLLLVDESSMIPGLDLADLVAYAEATGGKLSSGRLICFFLSGVAEVPRGYPARADYGRDRQDEEGTGTPASRPPAVQ